MDEVEILAKTIYGEARGERREGMEAVACVVINRVKVALAHGGKYWWGNDVSSVCLKKMQFSCWNENDPNSRVLERNLSGDIVYLLCEQIARNAIKGILEDKTNGATHYHTWNIKPKWAENKVPSATIGHHIFYKLED